MNTTAALSSTRPNSIVQSLLILEIIGISSRIPFPLVWRCKANGFPNQMITFQKSTTRKKPDGKPFWILLNGDLSGHEHILPQSTGMQSIKNIEDSRPPSRPPMITNKEQTDSGAIITRLERIEEALKLIALSNIAATQEERETVRAMVLHD
jgi:hypothetical protein